MNAKLSKLVKVSENARMCVCVCVSVCEREVCDRVSECVIE